MRCTAPNLYKAGQIIKMRNTTNSTAAAGAAVTAGQSRWMRPTAPKSYKAGQIIKLQVIVQTNHMGRFDFNLCPADASSDSQCKRLQRYVLCDILLGLSWP